MSVLIVSTSFSCHITTKVYIACYHFTFQITSFIAAASFVHLFAISFKVSAISFRRDQMRLQWQICIQLQVYILSYIILEMQPELLFLPVFAKIISLGDDYVCFKIDTI